MRKVILIGTLVILPLLSLQPAEASVGFLRELSSNVEYEQGMGNDQDDWADEEEAERSSEMDARANANFNAVMQQNVFAAPKGLGRKAPVQPASTLELNGRIMAPQADEYYDGDEGGELSLRRAAPRAEVPLPRYTSVRDQLLELREELAQQTGPAVVLGSAAYSGEARTGALALKLRLQVTLGAPGEWKTVPLIGESAVVVAATSGGKPLPLSAQNGYHVWVTRQTGEVSIEIDFLVPSRGPRGSIEYDFLVARTPMTRFVCRFPLAGLEPRLRAAVRSDIKSVEGATLLDATLRPTARIHLVGFRDLGSAEEREAKLYAESLNLLSIGEGALDLFTVIRYNILYAGTKEFQVRIPAGLKVVSADGKGAFRFVLEPTEGGVLLRGETAYPIRNNYEISLRLHRDLERGGGDFAALRPQPLGVEREYGWLGVEVTGKLKLEEKKRDGALAVDMRQLPLEMLESAVSPILLAYRYHSPEAKVRLAAQRLPEKEPASGSVDSVRAFSVLAAEGRVLTEMRIRLRNRLRHNLVLTLPKGAEVRSTLLDGQPVKPSRNDSGQLMLPLKRSEGGEHLQPFTLQVVLEESRAALSLFGAPSLTLPQIDLPVSSLAWSVFAPARNTYTKPEGDIESQVYWGTGAWHQAPAAPDVGGVLGLIAGLAGDDAAPGGADNAGAMPVRIQLPKSGKRLEYRRYWLDQAQSPQVSFMFARSWVLIPLAMLAGLVFALGLLLLGDALIPGQRLSFASWPLGLGLAALSAWPLGSLEGTSSVVLAFVLAVVGLTLMRGWLPDARSRLSTFAAELPARFREARAARIAERDAAKKQAAEAGEEENKLAGCTTMVWRGMLACGIGLLCFILLSSALRLGFLLVNPLGG